MGVYMKRNIARIAILVCVTILVVGGIVMAYKGYRSYAGNDPDKRSDSSSVAGKTNTSPVNTATAAQTPPAVQNTPEPSKKPQEKVKAKALYLTGWTVGSMKNVEHYIELAKNTEVNSYVVDIKDDDGLVGYETNIPAVKELKGWTKKYDVDQVIKAFHDNGIHVIGRLVCFKDPALSSKRPELAIKTPSGNLWRDNHGKTWLNPYNKDSWPFIIDIAKEAVQKGFDEIQFDYVRFANDGSKKLMNFGATQQQKYEAIDEFLAYARKEMPDVILSADVFAIICESPADTEGIGQNLEYVGKDVDYVSPMAYPSHYAVGQIINKVKFLKPDMEPYGVVYNTLVKAKERIAAVPGYRANVRPYLQDFTATWLGKGYYQSYGTEQVKQQIKAVTDAGYDEWILWDPSNHYSEAALAKEQ